MTINSYRPIKSKQGVTFRKFISQLEELGYVVEHRELIAADYGAPTMRKRFFLIARCDGKPIIWPEPTHGPADSVMVKAGLLKPYLGACTQLDFSLPCPSIFETAEEIKEKYGIRAVRPLAPKTMERIARGLKKFVLDNAEPFIVQVNHSGAKSDYCKSANEPLNTVTGKHGFGVVEPYLVQIGQTGFTADRSKDVREPLTTIVSKNEHCLIEPKLQMVGDGAGFQIDRNRYLAYCDPEEMDKLPFADPELEREIQEQLTTPYMGTNTTNHPGGSCEDPIHTITTGNQQCLISPTLIQYHSETSDKDVRGQTIEDPIMTVDSSNRYGLVTSFLSKFYKTGIGQDCREPLHTVTAKDRFGLVTIAGVDYQIVDIGLRMLEPKELYGCQGFPDDYIIDRDYEGKEYPRSEQVRRCGNAVCPPIPAALVRANLPELCVAERTPNCQINEEQSGQFKFA